MIDNAIATATSSVVWNNNVLILKILPILFVHATVSWEGGEGEI